MTASRWSWDIQYESIGLAEGVGSKLSCPRSYFSTTRELLQHMAGLGDRSVIPVRDDATIRCFSQGGLVPNSLEPYLYQQRTSGASTPAIRMWIVCSLSSYRAM